MTNRNETEAKIKPGMRAIEGKEAGTKKLTASK